MMTFQNESNAPPYVTRNQYRFVWGGISILMDSILCRFVFSKSLSHGKFKRFPTRCWKVFENINDSCFVFELNSDGSPLKLIHVNNVACKQLGYSKKELLFMSPFEIIHSSERSAFQQSIDEISSKGSLIFETVHVNRYGQLISCECSSSFFVLNEKKIVLMIVRDITERKRMVDTLCENEAKYRIIIENISDFVSILNASGQLIYASPSFENLLGYAQDKNESDSVFRFIHKDDVDGVQQKFAMMLQTKKATRVEFRKLHTSGNWLLLDVIATPIVDQLGQIDKIVVVARDMTERKRVEEKWMQSEKLVLVGELAAGVAHEIRNPLTSIKGYLQLLARKEENAHYCSIMISELERINGIVSEFLLIAKPQLLTMQTIDVQKVLNDVVELLNTNAIVYNVKIVLNLDVDKMRIKGDENQLKQVFVNVLKNSIEAMPNGGVVTIEGRSNQTNVLIRISDHGCGIPEEQICRLGEPFYTTKEKGTGLGLMVSKRIVEAHHGEILITSQEGVGTIVEISLLIN